MGVAAEVEGVVMAGCDGVTAAGRPCRRRAVAGGRFCRQHGQAVVAAGVADRILQVVRAGAPAELAAAAEGVSAEVFAAWVAENGSGVERAVAEGALAVRRATLRDLEELERRAPGVMGSALAASALVLAEGLDDPSASVTAKSMSARALAETMSLLRALVPDGADERDAIDELADRRAARRSAVG